MQIFNLLALTLTVSQVLCHPGDGARFGSSGPFVPIDECDGISTRRFFEEYVEPKKALVIRGAASQFPALAKWTDEYLAAVAVAHTDKKLVVETVKKETRDQEIKQLSLAEFLTVYRTRSLYLVNQVPDYLKHDVPLPQPLQCEQAQHTLEETVNDHRIIWFF